MSAPSHRHGRTTTPLHQRTQSQNNTLAIRIVPYTPPRLDPEGRTPSQASSYALTARRGSGDYDDHTSSIGGGGGTRRPSWIGDEKEEYATSPGSALSSNSALSLLLAKAKDEGVSGSKLYGYPSAPGARDPTSPALRSPSEVSTDIRAINASEPQATRPGQSPSPVSASSAGLPRPLSRRRNFVAVHSDKTFSLVPLGSQSRAHSEVSSNIRSPDVSLSYSSGTSGSHDRPSIDAWSDDRPSPALTGTSASIPDYSLPEAELVPFTPSPGSSSTHLVEDPITSSPWNYRMVGGLRKVPKTPDLKRKKKAESSAIASASSSQTHLAPLPEINVCRDDEEFESRTIVPKASFASGASAQTISTTSETTNYKVYGPSSSPEQSDDSLPLPSSSPNYEILGASSPAPFSSSPPGTSDSNENFIVHGDPSPSSSLVAVPRKPRPTYSQESLVVPPLRPTKKNSYERLGYYKQRSRENLRGRAGSLQSLKSISSIISSPDPSQVFLTAPVLINFGASLSHDGRAGFSGSASQQQQHPWLAPQAGSSTAQSITTQQRPVQMLQASPHQWSSQLSTVMSESEGGSERVPSRSVSPSTTGNGHRRRSSAGWASSMHSRQLQSISSSLAAQLEEAASGSESPDRPHPTLARAGQVRLVRHQDEHGDGLADLQEQPSRSGLSGFFSSSNSSSRNLHSSGSSRAGSFTSASIPSWARVYYGSGERRFLSAPSIAGSETESRPGSSSFLNNGDSPNLDQFPAVHSERRRAREVHPHPSQHPFSDVASMEISPAPMGDFNVFRSIKRKTSSIWSPHLRQDRRASRYSVWDPPSVSWSADTGILGKRNAQVVLFILGFVFPFAWMIAAVLPLPANPKLQMLQREDNSESNFGRSRDVVAPPRFIDETRFESARWWRNLNRIMSVVGLLIIGAIIALVVVGMKQGWMVRSS
ncbi:hypothetical protein B0H66DRAFT_619884 [Apodospora peruviana]|uniref:Serine-rich protein n=1 Tax=Apodospora peruviana TaxID=516989 RepID=A0AAE0ICF5_9PEZI|nr:hypothetical protein B0H66DRAFT_619884 [Apodospora peruviana]